MLSKREEEEDSERKVLQRWEQKNGHNWSEAGTEKGEAGSSQELTMERLLGNQEEQNQSGRSNRRCQRGKETPSRDKAELEQPQPLREIQTHRPFSLQEGGKEREEAVGRGKAYDGRSLAALSPQPFFSVRITSTSACCFFWKRRLEQ